MEGKKNTHKSKSMLLYPTASVISCSLLLLLTSQSNGFIPSERTESKLTIMNEGQPSTLFLPDSNYQKGLSRRRRWLVVDFDGTCTEHDTTPLLPRLAALATRSQSEISQQNVDYDHQMDLQKRLDKFQVLEDEFIRRYSEARSKMNNNNDNESTLNSVLDALDEPSCVVTDMVSESGCLSGLGHAGTDEMEKMLSLHGVTKYGNATEELEKENNGEYHADDKVEVRLRHDCESTLARILLEETDLNEDTQMCLGWSLAVLSINWCPALIDASLVQPVLRRRRNVMQVDTCDTEVPIWSNEVDPEGVVTLNVPGALAKRDRILELRRKMNQDCSETQSIIIYVGDSSTDLAGLLAADVGIIMGSSSSLFQIAETWGVTIVPLKNRKEHDFKSLVKMKYEGSAEKKLLWQVDQWQDIDEALQEIDQLWKKS